MKRIMTIAGIVILLLGLLPTGAVFAEQPNGHHTPFDASGYLVVTGNVQTGEGPGFKTFRQTAEMHGTIEGTIVAVFTMTFQAGGAFVSTGETTTTGKVNGLPGRTMCSFVFPGNFTGETTLTFAGESTVTAGKGALSHLRGTLHMNASLHTVAPYTGDTFTYSGSLYYDPHVESSQSNMMSD